ncbi:MAG: glycoside hydrolase family 2 TIM barrel-domain containing protein [Myxococcota bacterium]
MLAALLATLSHAEPVVVEVRQSEQGWQLYRGGAPYFIKGAGGQDRLDELVAAGGNSIRTWGADGLDELLDAAHKRGLTVTLGIWLGHERHGFDYSDPAQVAAQLAKAREHVLHYKDHPALLMWGIGNEMEGFEDGGNPVIWKAVNDIAAMVKELDPNHPTMTVTAEIGGQRIASLNQYGTAIDIHGINAYGGAASLPERYRAAGGVKPYLLTEFGPVGSWEIPPTSWGAPPELTSRQKAEFYRNTYEKAVVGAPGLALGSYAFIWGFKMEATETWFGMFLPDGSRLPVVDTMTELWSGQPPADRAPDIEPLELSGSAEVEPGTTVEVALRTSDPEGGPLTVRFALRPESGEYATGGDSRPRLPDIDGAILRSDVTGSTVRMPHTPGGYRLFAYVYDAAGNAATANVPLRVLGDATAAGPRLPIAVYDNGLEGMPWVPSGWMGDMGALSLEPTEEGCYDGSECLRMGFDQASGWGGIAWQNPPNNWGEQEGGLDVTGARALEFWARGEKGGERISVGVGLLGRDVAHPDSVRVSKDDLILRSTWKQYRIRLRKRADLTSVKTGFFVTIPGQGGDVIVYLDRIRFVE